MLFPFDCTEGTPQIFSVVSQITHLGQESSLSCSSFWMDAVGEAIVATFQGAITEMLGYSIPELTENQQYLVENVHDMHIKLG